MHTIMSLMVIWMALLLVSFTEARRKWDKIDPEVSLFYPGAHYIMLTFHDDGVTAKETYGTYMNQLLDILEKRKARVTFFVQGTNVEKYPEIIKRIHSNKHEIANLGWESKESVSTSTGSTAEVTMTSDGTPIDEEIIHLVKQTSQAIEKITGKPSKVFRPPYINKDKGKTTFTYYSSKYAELIRSQTGNQVVLWSLESPDIGVTSTDTSTNTKVIEENIMKKAKKGDIVLLHVTPTTVNAMGAVIDQLQSQGYETITLSEMLSFPDDKPHR